MRVINILFGRNVSFQCGTRFSAFVEYVQRTKIGKVQEYLHVGRVLLGLVKGIQGLCGGKVAVTETIRNQVNQLYI